MFKSSRIAAFVMGLLLVLGIGSCLGYLGYCKYRTLHPTDDPDNEYGKYYEDGKVYGLLAKHRDGARLFDQFKYPCIACVAMGVGLIALAIFRKAPPISLPEDSVPIDPLAD